MLRLAATALLAGTAAQAQDDALTVGYFLEWPMPFQFAKATGLYEERLGVPVEWVTFDGGTAMSAAMASGDVDISISQGTPPFVVATSAGQDLVALDVAVSYSDNDNCVVQGALEIDAANAAAELAGKSVAVPLGTAPYYGFLRQMEHFGVDVGTLNVMDMAVPDGSAAFSQGSVDVFCGWGGPLRRALETGNVLLTGPEKEALGILVFDVTSAPGSFVQENPDLVEGFLAVTHEMNARWNAGGPDAEAMIPVLAEESGMDEAAVRETLAAFVFPSPEEQASDKWLGGGVQAYMAGVAGVFVEAGAIEAALPSYDATVNPALLQAATQ
jgi:taurine transport system substrate-binding protein